MFKIGDIIRLNQNSVSYKVKEIDMITNSLPRYKLSDGEFEFWEYCIGWEKLISPKDILKDGKILTYDKYNCEKFFYEIYTILYESKIYYLKEINYEIKEFKELK